MASAAPREVRLNVYDLHQSNSWLQHIGLGVYHSGVEVGGVEYTFSEAGIGQHPPREIDGRGCIYKTTEVLGEFFGTIPELRRTLNELRRGDFKEGVYDVVRKNCNHFCDEFSFALVGRRIPPWVNRAASLGTWAGFGGQRTAPDGTPGRGATTTSGEMARGADATSVATAPAAPNAPAAPSRAPKELTGKQRQLLAKMRANRSSAGE